MADFFTSQGQMGYTAAITGESAVNMDAPTFMLPFAVCREMCYRMCIASDRDKHFGAFLACQANEDVNFQYVGYIMAYRYCLNALPENVAKTVDSGANAKVKQDVAAWNEFVKVKEPITVDPDEIINKITQKESHKKTPAETELEIVQLLVSWHHQKIYLPSIVEPVKEFDPYDETMVDLTGLPHAPVPTEPVEEAPEVIMGTVNADNLNVRAETDTTADILKRLAINSRVEILEQKIIDGVNWGRIADGWINMNYVTIDGEGTVEPTGPSSVENDNNIDSGNNAGSSSTGSTSTGSSSTGSTSSSGSSSSTGTNSTTVSNGNKTVIGSATVHTYSSLAIRTGPSTAYTQVGFVRKGDTFDYYQVSDNWVRMSKGWVSAKYLDLADIS